MEGIILFWLFGWKAILFIAAATVFVHWLTSR
jgi:hypothetical protein